MKKSKFPEEQIIRIFKEVEAGAKAAELPSLRHERFSWPASAFS